MSRQHKLAAVLRLIPGNECVTQRQRMVTALRQIGPINTIEARRDLDVMMPATRVHELRHGEGLNIVTHWIDSPTDAGPVHRVAVYTLHAGPWRSA